MIYHGSYLISACLVAGAASASAQSLVEMFTDWDPAWPDRFGITAVGYVQNQDYVVGNAEIMLGQLNIPKQAIGKIENKVTQLGVKADLWILPFWNVHAMIGDVDGNTLVTPALPGFDPIDVNYEGAVYGAGTTLAYGQDWWFVSVTGVYTRTVLESGQEDIPAWLVIPKIGARSEKFEVWVGATYQNVAEKQAGMFNVPNAGTAVYNIELEAYEAWNFQLGVRCAVTDSLFFTVEGGFGNRQSILGHLEWRFW